MAADWGPIAQHGRLHDRASYRYYWTVLQRAKLAGLALPECRGGTRQPNRNSINGHLPSNNPGRRRFRARGNRPVQRSRVRSPAAAAKKPPEGRRRPEGEKSRPRQVEEGRRGKHGRQLGAGDEAEPDITDTKVDRVQLRTEQQGHHLQQRRRTTPTSPCAGRNACTAWSGSARPPAPSFREHQFPA